MQNSDLVASIKSASVDIETDKKLIRSEMRLMPQCVWRMKSAKQFVYQFDCFSYPLIGKGIINRFALAPV